MATLPMFLSESVNGLPISVTSTTSPGELLHAATDRDNEVDQIWLYAARPAATNAVLTLEWGDTSDPDDRLFRNYDIPPASGLVLLIPGLRLWAGQELRVFVVNRVLFVGHVDRLIF